MICVVVLQNDMDIVQGPTGSFRGTCMTCDDDDVTEEVSMKLEDAIDTKDEIPEAVSLQPIKTEQEVRLWGVCEVVAAHASMSFVAPKKKKREITLKYLLRCVAFSGHILFEM
jgi:hypothetical protein